LALSVPGERRLFVVTCRRERAAAGQVSADAVRGVRENLALALDLLEREATAEPEGLQPARPLTAIERRVYVALISGYRVSSIARELHVSESTVRSHLRSIFAKYDVHSQAELFDKVLAHKSAGHES
jgi:DNA-binding NarL/FixJ family response regulator